MITCSECIKRLHPDDPRIPTGRYHQSTCDYYCSKPTYYRELEQEKPPQVVEHIHRTSDMGKKEFDLLQQTARKLEYLEKKFTEHTEYKRKVPVKSGGRGIKIE